MGFRVVSGDFKQKQKQRKISQLWLMKEEKEKEKLPTTMRILYCEKKVAIYF